MTLTIPQTLSGKELVIISRDEYESLIELKKIYEFQATSAQKKSLISARKNRKAGVFLNINELKNQLGLTD